ncbi:MAG TPA: hypothetical protein PK727_10105 [Bacteroidales bacterium]|jgi:hypothetical protein|nr:hypothetical protein [Bacteroidales bacterium]HNY53744.1 hypothetical protein [Bacteroidales bacterium]HOG57668.1 hypothetical protein [Bacteroidales bacterium]HPM88675.1 hypothetical protein [Bacteroidales bacterium]
MKRSRKSKDLRFQITGIDIEDVSITNPKTPFGKDISFRFHVNIEMKIDSGAGKVINMVIIKVAESESLERCGSIKVSCIFGVDNINSFMNPENGKNKLPEEFIHVLNSISISTARGVMYSQFRGTFLHEAVLPIIEPQFFQSPAS